MTEWLLESQLEKFLHGPLVKNEQKEVVVHCLQSKDVVILRIGSEESLICQIYAMAKEM